MPSRFSRRAAIGHARLTRKARLPRSRCRATAISGSCRRTTRSSRRAERKNRGTRRRMLKSRDGRHGLHATMDFSGATVLTLGDIMLDRFAYCGLERISPEAPVPVLQLQRVESMLGGAGNVARNIASLGGTAVLIGLLRSDAAGDEVRSAIGATPRLVDAHVASGARPTICKTRYIAAHQQMMRVDEEEVRGLDADEEARLIAAVGKALGDVDVVILSDYDKCVLGPKLTRFAISRAQARGIPVFVDPKAKPFRHYRGATCVTPNLAELAFVARMPVASEAEIIAAASRVLREAKAEAILAKRSDKGMLAAN